VAQELPAVALRERLLSAVAAALPVRDAAGQLRGVVTAGALGERWRQAGEGATVEQLMDAGSVLSATTPVAEALATLDAQGVDVLAVEGGGRAGVVTRLGLQRFLQGPRGEAAGHVHAFSVTELPR